MKTKILITVLMLLAFSVAGSYAQNGKKELKTGPDSISSSNPQTNIKVNKEFDKDGNLIRYDSTYSYYYSEDGPDLIMNDSILNDIKSYFNKSYPFTQDDFFDNFFFGDSLLTKDFFDDDYFSRKFQQNFDHMNELLLEMDSIKNRFFIQELPSKVPDKK